MKTISIVAIIGIVIFSSCKKQKNFLRFTDKQLDFVSYSKAQTLKFTDTNFILQILPQRRYRREFLEQFSVLGSTGDFWEVYEVLYNAQDNGTLGFQLQVDASRRSLSLDFQSYWNDTNLILDSLQPTFPTRVINGKLYYDVYRLKMYKDMRYTNNSDTATLFYNREFGVIQLLFPNGKNITRAE